MSMISRMFVGIPKSTNISLRTLGLTTNVAHTGGRVLILIVILVLYALAKLQFISSNEVYHEYDENPHW